MPLPTESDRRVAKGQYGTVEFAVMHADRMSEAWHWKEKLPEKKWLSFKVLFQRLLDKGEIHNVEQFKYLTNEICEFKRGGVRLLCYRDGIRFFLTNTLKKSGRKNIEKDIERSKTIGEGHLAWEKSQKKKLREQ